MKSKFPLNYSDSTPYYLISRLRKTFFKLKKVQTIVSSCPPSLKIPKKKQDKQKTKNKKEDHLKKGIDVISSYLYVSLDLLTALCDVQ